MRRFSHHLAAILGAGALVVALATGCSSGDPAAGATGASDQAEAQEGTNDDSAGDAQGEDENTGSVTVEVASGPHAGTHTRSGDLQCKSIGDGRWIVFAPGAGEADDIASLSLYYLPSDLDADGVDTPFPGEHQHLTIAFGSPIATGDDRIEIVDDDGGSLELATPTFDETMRPIHNFLATTADGVGLKIAAAPFACPPY